MQAQYEEEKRKLEEQLTSHADSLKILVEEKVGLESGINELTKELDEVKGTVFTTFHFYQ